MSVKGVIAASSYRIARGQGPGHKYHDLSLSSALFFTRVNTCPHPPANPMSQGEVHKEAEDWSKLFS